MEKRLVGGVGMCLVLQRWGKKEKPLRSEAAFLLVLIKSVMSSAAETFRVQQ